MIYDTIENISQYEGISDAIMKGLLFLAQTDFSKLPETRIELDAKRVVATIKEYESLLCNDTPEVHRACIDIQYLISGEEWVGIGSLSSMTEQVEARPEEDIWFYRGRTDRLLLSGTRFLVLWPGDAHAPGIAVGQQPGSIRKCVIKVKTENGCVC